MSYVFALNWGRKTKTDDPIKGIWIYTYNAFGELYTQKTARNHTFTFTYDLLGRKVRSYEPNEGTLCWNYGSTAQAGIHAAGKLTSTAKYEGSNVSCTTSTATIRKSLTYDSLGRPSGVTTTIGSTSYAQSQTYDSYSRPLVTTYPTGTSSFAVKNVYNSSNYLWEIRNNSNNALYKRIVDMTDRLQVKEVLLGNGVTSDTTYRADMGWLSDIDVSKGGTLNTIAVTYDGIGNVKTRESDYAASGLSGSHYTESYNYDNLNRLSSRTISIASGGVSLPTAFQATQNFDLDDWGNFTFKTDAGHYKYDSTKVHELMGVYSNASFTGTALYSFVYDNNGNITDDGTRSFTYASFDKPTAMSKSGVSSSMKYGVFRELYYKDDSYLEDGTSVNYKTTYLGSYEKVVRTGGEGNLTEHKYYVGDIIVTNRSNSSTDTYYLHKDHQGSVVATTNQTGNVISQAIYDPFGQRTAVYLDSVLGNFTYTEPTDRGYTGHKHIAELDIIHMGGRIYDPTLGRFMQADPIVQSPLNSQSYNRFAYVFNNPMSYTDPSGFSAWTKFRDKILKPIVAIVASFVVPFYATMSWGWGPAASYAAGGFVSGGIMTGSLRGAVAFSIMAYAGGGPTTFTSDQVAVIAAETIDPDVGKFINFLYNGIDSETWETITHLAHEVKNHYVSKEVAIFANKHGLSLTEFNALLTLNSFIGRELVGSRLKKNQHSNGLYNIMGFTTRGDDGVAGVVGILWDVNDTILGYQGLVDAVGSEYISLKGEKKLGSCHSLGTLTCNNLVARGYADSAQLNSLPFGNIAVGANAEAANLGRWDIVNGGFLGYIFNPNSNFTECGSLPCNGYIDNYLGKN